MSTQIINAHADKVNSYSKVIYNIIAEYIWIDGDLNLRSKTKIFERTKPVTCIYNFSDWNFDGSSTGQSETKTSDLTIRPIYYVPNPLIAKSDHGNNCYYYLVLCKVVNHPSNNYDSLVDIFRKTKHHDAWFGIEQEYIILDYDNNLFDSNTINKKSLDYNKNQHYCSVGSGKALGRKIAMDHMHACLEAGIKICGINSEVTPSQWEFQIGPINAIEVSHQLWVARYILIQIAESYYASITFHPKPFEHLNGSGAHTNFSTKEMRKDNGIAKIYEAINKLEKTHEKHILVYGKDNDKRLTGIHETANINTFSYGNCDRGSSIRIPINVLHDKKGYLEDRRPAANMDPYLVTRMLLETVCC